MSEKNGQGTPWSKGGASVTASTVATQKQQQQQQQPQHVQTGTTATAPIHPLYSTGVGALALTQPSTAPTTALYGGGLSGHQHEAVSYAAARFQAPSLDQHNTTAVASHTAARLDPSSLSAPSGFVPPPFPSSAAATSVLTPNPYAVAAVGGQNVAASSHYQHPFPTPHTHPAHFSVEQLQQLNAHQQYELSKLMAASLVNTANQGSGAALALPNTGNVGNVATVPPPPSQPGLGVRHQHTSTDSIASGSISSNIAENVLSAISSISSNKTQSTAITPLHGRLMGLGVHTPDEEKLRRIQHVVESGVSEHAKQQIVQILDRISTLRPVEKLLLYLRLPGETPESDPLRQPQNPLGTRSEINHTINWVRTHLEQDPQVSIPKQDVYNDYLLYCDRLEIKPLSTADFGKVMKQVFPGIRPRRLGTRGHSRYCYAAMRKTSKLPAPHLPLLSATTTTTMAESEGGVVGDHTGSMFGSGETQEQTWNVVKLWAENILHVKVGSLQELADYIKSNGSGALETTSTTSGYIGPSQPNIMHKKYTQREPKEKRNLADMGPLKKRRKKKRKGSSSSESSCNQPVTGQQQQQQQQQSVPHSSPVRNVKNNNTVLSPTVVTDEEQKSVKLVAVKQEIIDSPNYQNVEQIPPSQQTLELSTDKYLHPIHQQPHTHPQVLPINLVTEQRSEMNVVTKAPSTLSSALHTGHVRPSIPPITTAVKNLTPKIMELASESTAATPVTTISVTYSTAAIAQSAIKEELVDEYNPTNILCKKVRKAQQTKGFWLNSPTTPGPAATMAGAHSTIITTSASTPPPPPGVPASVITASNSIETTTVSSNYSMGPPVQLGTITSPNSQTLLDSSSSSSSGGVQPKVLSRNLQQLRAKKQMAAAANAALSVGSCGEPSSELNVDKDADLPENLGLPRERVISICNMDKHELDDYFLHAEEEEEEEEEDNAQDQETELLQYFQTGDAEEKLKLSSDAATNSNPTGADVALTTTTIPTIEAARMTKTTMITTTTITTRTQPHAVGKMKLTTTPSALFDNKANAVSVGTTQTGRGLLAATPSVVPSSSSSSSSSSSASSSASSLSSLLTTTVGSASASLAQMSQKHQLQQQMLHSTQPQQMATLAQTKLSIKRKINVSSNSANALELTAARRNNSFQPISPNINNNNNNSLNYAAASNGSFFASPGLTRICGSTCSTKPLFAKQQSLDCDSSDPMIGACRRRRNYINTTSASAPPSPVLRQQQQQQQQQLFGAHQLLLDEQWPPSMHPSAGVSAVTASEALLSEQNSLDLDLFGEAAAAASAAASSPCAQSGNLEMSFNSSVSMNDGGQQFGQFGDSIQRSQSVPLSQLQRGLSPAFNRSFQSTTGTGALSANYSACTSLTQTPVPGDFADSATLLSENSCSQQSGVATAAMKLEEVGVLASDSTAILDEVDVSEILSSPEFVTKFSSIAQSSTATTTCSSAGSSSGYSSGSGGLAAASGNYGNTLSSISRSVPSTPLPHNQQNMFGSNAWFQRRITGNTQTTNNGDSSVLGTAFASGGKHSGLINGASGGGGAASSVFSRSVCDISKSMPSTPITTPSFRYSPTEFTRDFLINGNTIDSITSSFGGVGSENLMGVDIVGVGPPLNSESLLGDEEEDNVTNISAATAKVRNASTPDFSASSHSAIVHGPSHHHDGGESTTIIVGSDILDNL